MSFKILKVTFTILLVVVLIEIGYYFYFLSQTKKKSSNAPPSYYSDLAIKTEISMPLRQAKKGILIKSTVTNEYEGIIVELKIDKDRQNITNFVVITIKSPYNDNTNIFSINTENLKYIKVVKVVKGQEQELSIDSLKKGNRISIIQSVDFLKEFKDNFYKQFKIINQS